MPPSIQHLRVSLRPPAVEASFFLADVRTRLEAVARRVGEQIVWSRIDASSELIATLSPSGSAALLDEAGIHRAQYVPLGSETGRILTALVEVHVSGMAAITEVVRNYNYPLRRCKTFRTNQAQSLDDVLAGAG
jgi:protein subunit release factor A